MRDRTTGEHSRVLSDVSLVPETLGISIMWLAKLALLCIVILWAAIIDINFLPIAIFVDVGVIIVAFTGRLVTPSHLDSFSGYLRAVFVEKWGSARLVSEPSHDSNNE
ncbi:hypothetical protein ACFQL7_27640 [Halocatena marina]|uniref:Uncharacterized protein n=1 Tax=Halocatena marina TaxID=2934937 RepID=A0ABD5YZV9_9EURY